MTPTRSKHFILPIAAALVYPFPTVLQAYEGMWLPTLLQAVEGHMRTEGLVISAEDIYSINNGSLKDATVLFGGGCTAEVISEEGLILTNHHCGFGAIAEHSSVDHDYLKNGFWAATRADELMNPGLTATFIVRMEDVTGRVLTGVDAAMSEAERNARIAKACAELVAEATAGNGYSAVVRPFNYGNSWYLIVSQTFRDVRLVGAPPGGIGNFGGDTDNWMWPRHTGDFSLFRIYAGPDNAPAEAAIDNVPYKPRRSLAICMDGVREGDFAMIYGFPGNTQRYITSHAVRYVQEVGDPLRIRMRRASLAVIDEAMLSSDKLRIAYADKQKGISNAYKKWIGELRGITELRTLEKKLALEQQYRARALEAGRADLIAALDSIGSIYAVHPRYARARDAFSELYGVGADLLRFAWGFEAIVAADKVAAAKADGSLVGKVDAARQKAAAFHRDFDRAVDMRILKAQLPLYAEAAGDLGVPLPLRRGQRMEEYIEEVYRLSAFADPARLDALLAKYGSSAARKLGDDPAYRLAKAVMEAHVTRVKPVIDANTERLGRQMRVWMSGLIALFPERTWWPDANSTLRLSYGHVEGSTPRDGMRYLPFTDLDGVMEKDRPGDAEFDVPQRLRELYASKDFGPYSTTGEMPVCFTSSLHTTGGNSGSPVFNGRGELIGINFDRTWESTMSDIEFDPAKCRNISADIRYVLFVIDKVCGAGHLVKEMKLVRHADAPAAITLPIHR
jgi:hypothetical protein